MDTGITPVMPVGDGAGNSFMYLFGLLILLGLFNGNGFGGNNGNSNAIQNDINRGFDNQNLQAQTRDILNAVTSGTAQTISASTANATNAINAIKDGNAGLIREFGNVENSLTALGGNMQNCCCDVKQLVMQTSFDTNTNLTAQIQSVKDMISQNKIEALQAQINKLELQNATSGMLKFPNTWSYDAGQFPPIFGA